MKIKLPYPPSINHYYCRVNRTSRNTFISKKGRDFRNEVIIAWNQEGGKTIPVSKNIVVSVCVIPPDNRRRDIDNLLKPLLDALQHAGAYEDDNQIVSLSISKTEPDADSFCTVDINLKDKEKRK